VCDNRRVSTLDQPIAGASRTEIGGLVVDEVAAGRGRIKRVIYPPGWRFTTHMAPVTGGRLCTHAHVGMLVQGSMVVEYEDGCRDVQVAPAAVVVAPGHDSWVEGDQPAILIQYDCGPDTVATLDLPAEHRHGD
jgi:hypothetical protein